MYLWTPTALIDMTKEQSVQTCCLPDLVKVIVSSRSRTDTALSSATQHRTPEKQTARAQDLSAGSEREIWGTFPQRALLQPWEEKIPDNQTRDQTVFLMCGAAGEEPESRVCNSSLGADAD